MVEFRGNLPKCKSIFWYSTSREAYTTAPRMLRYLELRNMQGIVNCFDILGLTDWKTDNYNAFGIQAMKIELPNFTGETGVDTTYNNTEAKYFNFGPAECVEIYMPKLSRMYGSLFVNDQSQRYQSTYHL